MPSEKNTIVPLLTDAELHRFMSKVKKGWFGHIDENGNRSDCWEWRGYRSNDGYGKVHLRRIRTSMFGAHRIALAHFTDFDCMSRILALHRCDHRACCNPDHLYPGTHLDNSRDKFSRKRQRLADVSGERNPRSVLSERDVLDIVRMLDTFNNKQIAAMMDNRVTHSMVSSIRLGKSWTKVTGFDSVNRKRYASIAA